MLHHKVSGKEHSSSPQEVEVGNNQQQAFAASSVCQILLRKKVVCISSLDSQEKLAVRMQLLTTEDTG